MTTLLSALILFLTPITRAQDFDLEKLAHAVAVAETSNCTKGVGVSKNNCQGITKKGGGFRTFQTTAESFAAFKDLWPRVYGLRFPTATDAKTYTGNDNAATWLRTVNRVYAR